MFPHFPQTTMTATAVSMDYLVWKLGQILDRPVINRTNLDGAYHFEAIRKQLGPARSIPVNWELLLIPV
jgi:uncharacterized protein (TIGR03435 family)